MAISLKRIGKRIKSKILILTNESLSLIWQGFFFIKIFVNLIYKYLQIMALSEQRKRFADRYFETLNGSESAIYAGYSANTSRQIAHNLLQEPEIEEYLSKLKEDYQLKSGISRERILEEYSKIAFSDIRELYSEFNELLDIRQIDDDTARAVSSVEVDEITDKRGNTIGVTKKVKLYNKLSALDSLGKVLGIFEKDNYQSSNNITNVVNLGTGIKPKE